MRLSQYLRRRTDRDDSRTTPEADGNPRRRPLRYAPTPNVLGLLALFGAVDVMESVASPRPDRGIATTATDPWDSAPAGLEVVEATFAIHWEPLDRQAALHRDIVLTDGWVRIPMDRSAT